MLVRRLRSQLLGVCDGSFEVGVGHGRGFLLGIRWGAAALEEWSQFGYFYGKDRLELWLFFLLARVWFAKDGNVRMKVLTECLALMLLVAELRGGKGGV
jgi:hypothetical protein